VTIQYKNARFSLTGTAQTTVLTLSVSSRAILQNIQTQNVSSGTTTVTAHMYDSSVGNTSEISTIKLSSVTTQNLAKGPIVLEESDALKLQAGTGNVIKGMISYALLTGDQGTA
jgi:hypothetical protein|tara:strand:+ start:832 stop:1173 length:342 start_codon:yes stop_codon:yes gene_type:complete